MIRFFKILIPFLMLSACSPSPKERTLSFGGIENARELGGLVMQDGSLPAYLEKALGFTAGEQERMRQKYLR